MIAALARPPVDPDTAYDALRQRWVDAYEEGRRAALLGLGAGLSSQYIGRELKEWMAGYADGGARRAVDSVKRARRSCLGCNCGGMARCVGDSQ